MKTVFRYFLLLGVLIIPLFVLLEDDEKFPILFGAFLGVTITFWIAIWIVSMKKKKEEKEKES
jgi:hypothetical protein